jgi:Ribbon-helix-helix protein, copG family
VAHRFCLIISDDQYRVLDEEADRSGISISELIRRGIDTLYMPDPTRPKVREIIHTLGRRPGRRIS